MSRSILSISISIPLLVACGSTPGPCDDDTTTTDASAVDDADGDGGTTPDAPTSVRNGVYFVTFTEMSDMCNLPVPFGEQVVASVRTQNGELRGYNFERRGEHTLCQPRMNPFMFDCPNVEVLTPIAPDTTFTVTTRWRGEWTSFESFTWIITVTHTCLGTSCDTACEALSLNCWCSQWYTGTGFFQMPL